jgi:predicted acetyltransferase
MAKLVRPCEQYKCSYLEAIAEFQQEGMYLQLDIESLARDFQPHVDDLLSRTERNPDRPELVPETTLWLLGSHEYIGAVSVRHELNASLLRFGGNIGYDIRPSKRMRGYGKLILRLALVVAQELGLTRVLLTCRPTNVGSWKIIEANGGVLENEIDVETPDGVLRTRRYWIDIN